MAVTYTWQIGPLNVKLAEDGLTHVVHGVNWRLICADENHSADVYGSTNLSTPTTADFTPYDQLTETQVQQWVVDALGFERVECMKINLANQIELQKNPVDVSLQPPWSSK